MIRSLQFCRSFRRHLLVFTGVVIFLWSGVEDNHVFAVTALGGLSAISLTAILLSSRFAIPALAKAHMLPLAATTGALVGSLASLSTTALMLFKDVRHSHVFPDYPPEMILAILERLPFWALAGGLTGIGIGILLMLKPQAEKTR